MSMWLNTIIIAIPIFSFVITEPHAPSLYVCVQGDVY